MYLSVNHAAREVALVAEDTVRAPKQVIAFIVGQVLRVHRSATCVALSVWLMMACHVSCVGSHLLRPCDFLKFPGPIGLSGASSGAI